MGINPNDFLYHVIRPSLERFEGVDDRIHSKDAEALLLCIAAHEGAGISRLAQVGGGPALGPYQMEPPTLSHVFDWSKRHRSHVAEAFYRELKACHPQDLRSNLTFATIAARTYLWMAPAALPSRESEFLIAQFWYKYWCRGCAGAPQEFVHNALAWRAYPHPDDE